MRLGYAETGWGKSGIFYMYCGSDVTCSVTVDSTLCVGYRFPGAQNSMKNSLVPGPLQLSFLSHIFMVGHLFQNCRFKKMLSVRLQITILMT